MSRTLGVLLALVVTLSVLPASAQDLPLPLPEEPDELPVIGEAPPGTVTSPSDALTVTDPAQATGRRMALPLPDCEVEVSRCADVRLINTLDGFDVLPRVSVRLDRAPEGDLDAAFGPDVLAIRPAAGGDPIGLPCWCTTRPPAR